jgi:hypothetical protein
MNNITLYNQTNKKYDELKNTNTDNSEFMYYKCINLLDCYTTELLNYIYYVVDTDTSNKIALIKYIKKIYRHNRKYIYVIFHSFNIQDNFIQNILYKHLDWNFKYLIDNNNLDSFKLM